MEIFSAQSARVVHQVLARPGPKHFGAINIIAAAGAKRPIIVQERVHQITPNNLLRHTSRAATKGMVVNLGNLVQRAKVAVVRGVGDVILLLAVGSPLPMILRVALVEPLKNQLVTKGT